MNSLYQNQSIERINPLQVDRQCDWRSRDGTVFTGLGNHHSNKVDLAHSSCGVNTGGQSETLLYKDKGLLSCGLRGGILEF